SRTRRTISLCPLRDSAGEPTGCERICGMCLGILILVTAPHDLTFLSLSLLRLKVERYEDAFDHRRRDCSHHHHHRGLCGQGY
ncbi:unnamed protein product, partial [Mycena citricolor]